MLLLPSLASLLVRTKTNLHHLPSNKATLWIRMDRLLHNNLSCANAPFFIMMNLYTKQFIQIPLPESRSPFVMILRFAEVWVGLKLPRPFSYRYLEFWWNVSNGQAFSPGISSDFRILRPGFQVMIPKPWFWSLKKKAPPKHNCQKQAPLVDTLSPLPVASPDFLATSWF